MTPRRPWGSAQRKGSNWYAVYTAHKGSKRRVWEPVYPNTRTRALDVLAQRQVELAAGVWDDPTRVLSFASLAAEWYDTMVTSWRPWTANVNRSRLNVHILPALGDLDVKTIDGAIIQRTLASLDLAPRSVRGIITTARQVLKWGHRLGRIRTLRDLTVKLPPVPRSNIDPLTAAEVKLMLEHAAEWRPLLMWAVLTGMRQGEICAAKWANLDAGKGTYRVIENMNRTGQLAPTKTGEVGNVWVPVELLDALEDQRQQNAAAELAAPRWEASDAMFPGLYGGHRRRDSLVRLFRTTCDRAELRRRPFHHLRHTCASLLVHAGETIPTVQHQLRHRHASITLDTYTHLMPDAGADALQRLGKAIG